MKSSPSRLKPHDTKSPRLYVDHDLSADALVELDSGQAHYLRDVMRLDAGAPVRLFNGRDGAWLGQIETLAKKKGTLRVSEQTHPQREEQALTLIFAPIKSARLDMLIEKAVELGVSRLQPVLTERTQTRRINIERVCAQVIEASEQCERLSVPEVEPLTPLFGLLESWPNNCCLWYGDETGQGESAISAYSNLPTEQMAVAEHAIIVGPEGGFSPSELDLLASSTFSKGVSLGPRILRAETAAIVALSLWQATLGDGVLKPRS